MTVTTTEANNIADLPRVCRHGYTVVLLVVKIWMITT